MASRAAVWLLIPIALGTLRAQDSQGVRTFRIAATYDRGQPVTDLRLDEVRLFDAGKRGSVVLSRFLSVATPKESALLPHEFTNRVSGHPSASTLILLDLFNADFTERSTVCQEIIQTLMPMAPSATVFLFVLEPDTSVSVIHGWMPPGGSTERPSGLWTRQISDLLQQGLEGAGKLRHAGLTNANTAANLSYQALKDLGAQYAALSGQKRLVWITRGMPLILTGPNGPLPLIFQTLLQQTATEFRQFGIPIYTVHEKDKPTANVDRATAIDSLASLTGGRSFESEAAARAITEAQTDSDALYLGGFYSAGKDAAASFMNFASPRLAKALAFWHPAVTLLIHWTRSGEVRWTSRWRALSI
jgi:VWFA-related protein